MTREVKIVNDFLKNATKTQVDKVLSDVILSDRQKKVFDLYCVRGLGIGFTADTIGVCPMVVNNELKIIRMKIYRHING
ncbi:MAG: hypothetical protein IKP60_07250 [Treponema sp.]|nr:hypothetical protein [Treponema sp.]